MPGYEKENMVNNQGENSQEEQETLVLHHFNKEKTFKIKLDQKEKDEMKINN